MRGETEATAWVRGPLARLVRRAGGITWVRGPPARLVRGVGGMAWVRGPLARLVRGTRGITWLRGPLARLGAERLLTAGRIIGLLKYPLELGKIRRG